MSTLGRIPADLRAWNQWVLWARDAEGRKVPDGSVREPDTWLSFAEARRRLKHGDRDGLGFVFTADDPFVGVDLDGCVTTDGGVSTIDPWAFHVVRRLGSYTEFSPSRTGLHVIVAGALPPGSRHKVTLAGQGSGGKAPAIEAYAEGRYFTITGDVLTGYPRVRRRPRSLQAVVAHYLAPCERAASAVAAKPRLTWLTDAAVLAAVRVNDPREHAALLRRDPPSDADRSQLDFRLACLLTRYVGADPARIERLMRRSPLVRDKWDRPGYLDRYTIPRAIQSTSSFVVIRRKGAA